MGQSKVSTMKSNIFIVLLVTLSAKINGQPRIQMRWNSTNPNYKPRSEGCETEIPSWMLDSDRIVGGQDATSPIPWQAWIGGCGATILDAKTLLSAAHCFVRNGTLPKPSSTYVEIRVGSITSDFGGQVQYGAQLIWNTNPGYQFEAITGLDNDFVILKLNEPLELDENVKPACLPPSNYLQEDSTENLCYTNGWGITDYDYEDHPDTLQFVRVPTVTQTDCIDAYSENQISKSMICAGYPEGGKDACTNDSGGPLVCYNSNNGKAILVGVVSWSGGCALPNKFGVYGRVTHVLDWIKENMENPSETTTTEPSTNECERPDWLGDNYCDDDTNNAACKWDGGDCCNNDNLNWKKYCKVCECLDPDESAGTCEKPRWIGDTYCDDATNNAACKWDGGDCCNNDNPDWKRDCKICECLDPDESPGTCEKPGWIGDTYCDDETNNAACNWDGGDCCNNDNPDWKEYCTVCECIIES